MWIGSALVQVKAFCQLGTKPSSEPMPRYCESDPEKKWNSNQNSKLFIHENADVVCEKAPTCPSGVKTDWYDMIFFKCHDVSELSFWMVFYEPAPVLVGRLADLLGCFKMNHSLIDWYVNTCGVELYLHKLFGGTLQFDTHQPKLPLPLAGTQKSGIMQGCDHTILTSTKYGK